MANYPSVISLARSPALLLVVGLFHLVPMLSVLSAGVPAWVRWWVVPLCLASAVREGFVARRLHRAKLKPHAEGAQLLISGLVIEGRVLPASVEMGPLLVLHWQAEDASATRRFALLRYSFPAEEWRVLKVWLRWSVKQGK